MTEPLFDLVITGQSSAQPLDELVRSILKSLGDESPYREFKVSEALLFNGAPIAIMEGVTLKQAHALKKKLAALSVDSEPRPALQVLPKEVEAPVSSESMYVCPACGHNQPKLKDHGSRLDACEACGIVGERYERKKHKEEILRVEKQKHETEKSRRIREVLERAKLEEEARLREEARHQLGLLKKDGKDPLLAIGVVTVAILLGLGIYYYYHNLPGADEKSMAEEAAAKAKGGVAPQAIAAAMKALNGAAGLSGEDGNAAGLNLQDLSKNLQNAMDPGAAIEDAEGGQGQNAQSPEDAGQASVPKVTPTSLAEALKIDVQKQRKHKSAGATVEKKGSPVTMPVELVDDMEQQKLMPARFGMPAAELAESRQRLGQFLKLNEPDLAQMLIDRTDEPYPHTLLLLDVMEWQIKQGWRDQAQNSLALIQSALAQSKRMDEQVLILGGVSKAHLLLDQWDDAGKSLEQALVKALSPADAGEQQATAYMASQLEVLVKLANEQSLFGNQIAAGQILDEARKAVAKLQANEDSRSQIVAWLASSYAMIAKFNEANSLLNQVKNSGLQQKLASFIDQLQQKTPGARPMPG